MPTVHVNITAANEWYVGEDKQLSFTVRDEADNPVNISGWTMEYILRIAPSHPEKKLSKTTTAGITLDPDQTGAGKGKLYIDIDAGDTDHLRAGTYAHGLVRTNAGVNDIVIDGTAYLGRSAASTQDTAPPAVPTIPYARRDTDNTFSVSAVNTFNGPVVQGDESWPPTSSTYVGTEVRPGMLVWDDDSDMVWGPTNQDNWSDISLYVHKKHTGTSASWAANQGTAVFPMLVEGVVAPGSKARSMEGSVFYARYQTAEYSGANRGYVFAAEFYADIDGAGVDVLYATSLFALPTVNNGAHVDTLTGLNVRMQGSGSANADLAYGVRIQKLLFTGATYDATRGVHIDDMGSGANDFNIYSAGTASVNRFEGSVEFVEKTDPAAPAANNARLYAKDNGSGKTQLVVRFATGAVQVLATEP